MTIKKALKIIGEVVENHIEHTLTWQDPQSSEVNKAMNTIYQALQKKETKTP